MPVSHKMTSVLSAIVHPGMAALGRLTQENLQFQPGLNKNWTQSPNQQQRLEKKYVMETALLDLNGSVLSGFITALTLPLGPQAGSVYCEVP